MSHIYFKDTDTLVFDFSDEEIVDYIDLDSETLLELDGNGNPVALTIEFARKRVSEQVSSGPIWNREASDREALLLRGHGHPHVRLSQRQRRGRAGSRRP